MAKLMAPNIRIDWYPEGHFADVARPTLAELNSGHNLSCAIVTGFTLDFADSNTEDTTSIFDTFTSENILNHSYEADLEFFLAPRGSVAEGNEAAYRKAEELFYNAENRTGYLAKRFGFPWDKEYNIEHPRQKVDLFKVQADLPKVVSEDGAPIMLKVKYIPQGEAVSSALAGQITYRWVGEPHNSVSDKYSGSEVVASNIFPRPSFEQGIPGESATSSNVNTSIYSGDSFVGGRSVQLEDQLGTSGFQLSSWDIGIPTTGGFLSVKARSKRRAGSSWLGIRLAYYSDSWVYSDTIWLPISSTQWRESEGLAYEFPAGVSQGRVSFYISSNDSYGAPAANTRILIDGISVSVGDTEAEALAQVHEYFDGDTPDE